MHNSQHDRDAKSQRRAECDETPESRKSEEEYETAPQGKQQTDKAAPDWEFMHADSGMLLLCHRYLTVANHPTRAVKTQARPGKARQADRSRPVE